MSTRLVEDPGWRRAVAGADPRALVWQPRFWRGQLPLGTILLGSAVLLRVLAPYTYSWSDGWSGYLSVAVQLLAVWGVVICVQGLATLDVDTALAAEMEARGSEYLVSLRSGTRARVDLDEAERTIAPSNPASPTPAPVRLFQQIIKEARDRRFESGGILTQPYREEALEDIFRLQNLQKIALWLGILGTFVGLLVALQRADLGTTSDPEGLARMVQEMYGGLFISFTASVAGLEVAIILGFLLLVVRKRQERYFAVLESAVVTLLSVARHAVNRDDFLAEFSQVNAAMRELSGRVYEQTQETSEGLQGVHRRLEAQNARIDTGLAKLVETRGEFDGFLRQIGETEREFIADLRRVFHAASFKDFGAA
jgi:biopolymer transport protein ExbB/TolQ